MYLKRLELQGFKSFAHKTVLDFDPGMTAVVGPNGSGKSNVADGLRWVMGEQSLKLLRGKKSEDVIFAGSDKKSKLSMAEVALTFDNKDHKIPVEYSEVVIMRRLFRSGESEYLMNNQRVRLLDVVDALVRSGFGASNYTVIGQGTIDQMIMAGPTEIKNLVEEASGVKPYYLKREKTIRRLTQTEENLSKVAALLAEIEPRLRSLRRQAKRMEEREAVVAELSALQLQFFGHRYYVLETDLAKVLDKLSVKNAAVRALESEIGSFQKTLEKEEQHTTRSDDFVQGLDIKLRLLEERRLALAEQLAEIKGRLKIGSTAAINFSEFQDQFEAILDSMRADNIDQVKRQLKELVFQFGHSENDELSKQKEVLMAELAQIVKEMEEQQRLKHKMWEEERQKKQFLSAEEKKFRAKSNELAALKDEEAKILVEKAKLDTRLENLDREAKEALGEDWNKLIQHKTDQLAADVINKIGRLKRQLELAGAVDEATIQEYKETEERFGYLSTQSDDLNKAVVDLKSVIEELDQIIKKQFDEAFDRIAEKFSEYFRILFNGGQAKMTLLKTETEDDNHNDDEDEQPEPTQQISGIEIKATPPGKKLATVAVLSGGERALTSIAMLCSMLACYPSPFVVLDEVDAALDEANSIRFAKILGTLAHQTQFITITHNRETMRQAHTLYGVTMGDDGISKVLSIKLDKAEELAQ